MSLGFTLKFQKCISIVHSLNFESAISLFEWFFAVLRRQQGGFEWYTSKKGPVMRGKKNGRFSSGSSDVR